MKSAHLCKGLITTLDLLAHNSWVSRTRKDASQTRNTILELVRSKNGTFDLFLNNNLDRSSVPEQYLNNELCVRLGFCGEEYDTILREVKQKGRAVIRF
jgi:hypothetical protein